MNIENKLKEIEEEKHDQKIREEILGEIEKEIKQSGTGVSSQKQWEDMSQEEKIENMNNSIKLLFSRVAKISDDPRKKKGECEHK